MALAVEQYAVHAHTRADGKKRSVQEAEQYTISRAKAMDGVLHVQSSGLVAYREDTDKYVFGLEVLMTHKPY